MKGEGLAHGKPSSQRMPMGETFTRGMTLTGRSRIPGKAYRLGGFYFASGVGRARRSPAADTSDHRLSSYNRTDDVKSQPRSQSGHAVGRSRSGQSTRCVAGANSVAQQRQIGGRAGGTVAG